LHDDLVVRHFLKSALDIAAQIIEASHEAKDGFGSVASGEVVGTEVMIFAMENY
jgi:hypothetical protein